MHPQRADIEEAGTHRPGLALRTDHWLRSLRTGLASPAIFWPLLKVVVVEASMTVIAPGPLACHSPSAHTAALRSSIPSRVTSGSSLRADSIHRLPNVSK